MDQNTGGYQTDPFVAELYDQVVPYAERPDIDFFVQTALDTGGPVLEVGCGTGRVLIPTARAGISITGLDLSPYMLEVCRQSLENEPAEVQDRVVLVEGDMRDFDLGQSFSLITTPFRPFQHLITTEDQIKCLEGIHRHLKPGGFLILDIFNPSLLHLTRENMGEEKEIEPEFTTPGGIKVQRKDRIVARDYARQVQDVELIYYLTHPDGRKERLVHAFPMRYLFRFEAEHLLARCGFEVVELYSDYQKKPFGTIYPGELIFLAKRTAP
jgi:SAM-dependent methyltransferase